MACISNVMNKLYQLEMNSDFENVCITVVYLFHKNLHRIKMLKCANTKCKELNVTDLCLWNMRCQLCKSIFIPWFLFLFDYMVNKPNK